MCVIRAIRVADIDVLYRCLSLGCCIPQASHDTIAWPQTKRIISQQQSHSLKPPDFGGVKRKS
ncbi:Tip elongation aberrant protein 3 [Clarias magur]|uniref:Tip elongation aberrant protein 3 n=1 Tax=Clarias magur TaxID=1594786 RepID=A0A8J4USZ7_CLAMG|nr:Tip elongation aberrant protein 3 [Clarias magur]